MAHRLGWVAHVDGVLKGPEHTRVDLQYMGTQELKGQVGIAWMATVQDKVQHKHGLEACPVLEPSIGVDLLRKFPSTEHRTLARDMVGGWMSQARKCLAGLVPDAMCLRCGQPDDRSHRLLACPSTASTRAAHRQAVEEVQRDYPHWLAAAVAPVHDLAPFLRLYHQARKPPEVPPLPSTWLGHEPDVLHVYTDGACCHPAVACARRAAFGVVLDQSGGRPVAEPGATFDTLCHWGLLAFLPLQLGLVHGHQTVARAELLAALQALRAGAAHGKMVVLHTDSAYVVAVIQRLRQDGLAAFNDRATNLDLVRSLAGVLHACEAVVKVKAHVQDAALRTAGCLLTTWRSLGNRAADAAAGAALQSELQTVVQDANELAACTKTTKRALARWFGYLVDLRRAQKQADEHLTDATPGSPDDFRPGASSLHLAAHWVSWAPPSARAQPLPALTKDVCVASTWPPGYTQSVWQWLQSLRWPTEVNSNCAAGATWLELFLDWAFYSNNLPPVMCGPRDKGQQISFHLPSPKLHLSTKSFTARLQGFAGLVQQLGRLTGASPLPCSVVRKITSLSTFGDSESRRGVLQRPVFTCPEAVYGYLAHLPPGRWTPASLTTAVLHRAEAPTWPAAAASLPEWHALPQGQRHEQLPFDCVPRRAAGHKTESPLHQRPRRQP